MLKSISDYRNELSQLLDTIEKDPNAKDRNYGPEVRILMSELTRQTDALFSGALDQSNNTGTATLATTYMALETAHDHLTRNSAVYSRVLVLTKSGLIN